MVARGRTWRNSGKGYRGGVDRCSVVTSSRVWPTATAKFVASDRFVGLDPAPGSRHIGGQEASAVCVAAAAGCAGAVVVVHSGDLLVAANLVPLCERCGSRFAARTGSYPG